MGITFEGKGSAHFRGTVGKISETVHDFQSEIFRLSCIFAFAVVIAGFNIILFSYEGAVDEQNTLKASKIAESALNEAAASLREGDVPAGVPREMTMGSADDEPFKQKISITLNGVNGRRVTVEVAWKNFLFSRRMRMSRDIDVSKKLADLEEREKFVTGSGDSFRGALFPVDDGNDAGYSASFGDDGICRSKK